MHTPIITFGADSTWDRLGHYRTLNANSNPDNYMLLINNNTQHSNYALTSCNFVGVLEALGNPTALAEATEIANLLCKNTPPGISLAQFNQITVAYTIAFLETIVKGNTKYALMLNPQVAYLLENGNFNYWQKNWGGPGNAQWQGITSVVALAYTPADATIATNDVIHYFYDGNFTYWNEQPNFFAF